MRLTINIENGVRPVCGWLEPEVGPRVEFQGMIELLSLLDGAADEPPDSDVERTGEVGA